MQYETSSPTRPRQDLQGAYTALNLADRGLVADLVLPPLSVGEEAGVIPTISREVYLQRINTKRAPKASTSTADWASGTDSFSLTEYAHKGLVTERDARRFRSFFDAEEVEAKRVMEIIATDREIDTAAAVFNTTTFGTAGVNRTTLAGGAEWDVAGGVPLTNVAAAKQALVQNYGTKPNTLIIPYYVMSRLMTNTQFRNAFTGFFAGGLIPAEPSVEHLKAIFGLENVIVPFGIYNSANAGATPSYTPIWNEDYVMVCRIESGADHRAPQLGRTLQLDGNGVQFRSYENDDPEGVWIHGKHLLQPKIMPTPVGHLITNVKA